MQMPSQGNNGMAEGDESAASARSYQQLQRPGAEEPQRRVADAGAVRGAATGARAALPLSIMAIGCLLLLCGSMTETSAQLDQPQTHVPWTHNMSRYRRMSKGMPAPEEEGI